ncbi:MAG: YafY family transcriptional regulator [Solirubrobacteraceae bacterium]|nr:YafY family transcriptional regulator [Solirubrobacteraceae bacterium]
MRRADRLFQIVQQLRGGRLVTARHLSEQLNVSERTIYRDVAALVDSGVPIQGAAGVGYLMQRGFDLPPLMFTTDEVVALVAGARLLQAFSGSELAKASNEALVKIAAVLPEPARRRADAVPIHAYSVWTQDVHRRRLDELGAAVDGHRRLELLYRDGSDRETRRTVRPLGLVFWTGVWTLVAWCELRDGFRSFRIDRIVECERGLRFTPQAGQDFETALAALRDARPA